MRIPSNAARPAVTIFLLALAAITASGCSRTKYRLQADNEAHAVISERKLDPRWAVSDYSVEMDPRSRYYDIYDPDHSPMPRDDPTSHQYMECVDGKKGWKHWDDNGQRIDLENPAWREALPEYVEIAVDGSVKLDIDSAIRLAYINSPSNQDQLETIYLSALDVTAERFRLDTQFFGGYDARSVHNGSLIPPQLSYSSLLNRFVITPAIDGPGVENNRLTVGRPFGADPALLAQRRFATAGELLIGFANSFVFEFTGSDANLTSSLVNFSFIQPLLRGAGRDIALEQLTLEERLLLSNLRAYGQYRQGFYTQVAIGELGVTGPQRLGSTTTLQSFSGQGSVGGYLGLLQQLQEIRNSEDNLSLQIRTLARLEALLENDLIDLVQVDQFRQDIERQRSNLLSRQNSLQLDLDRYKTGPLGLPPDLPVELDDRLIRQFQLVPREASPIQQSIIELQRRVGGLPDDATIEEIDQALGEALQVIEPVRQLFDGALLDVARMNEVVPARERTMTDQERELFRRARQRLTNLFAVLELGFADAAANLQRLHNGLSQQTRRQTSRGLVKWVAEYLQLVERFVLIPAQARLESIVVDSIDLESKDAFQIALTNRLDFMNGRAALVDRWRSIQVNADALQSVLNVTGGGDIRTARNNPISFRAPTANVRMGFEFDAPFTRLLERNAYRESLISYERSRRDFIQSRDSLNLGLRALLRNLEQLRQDLEIQRRAVTIAMSRVDQTQLLLNPPRQPPQPGQRPPINPTTAINLLGAQTSFRDTQNALLAVWLNYYATRMRLYRELGTMRLTPDGRWIEDPIGRSESDVPASDNDSGAEQLPLPPKVPNDWMAIAKRVEQRTHDSPRTELDLPADSAADRPTELRRLPPTMNIPDEN